MFANMPFYISTYSKSICLDVSIAKINILFLFQFVTIQIKISLSY